MGGLAGLIGNSPLMLALRAQVERLLARPSPAGGRLPPLLLLGETGVGKGLLVRLMHEASVRRERPLIELNCAAIPESLVEAELFGHERGAFTDARQSRPGLFQAAHGGLLFLDEVNSLPLATQAKLLTAIEQREVRRLGSTRADPVDAWIVSATNTRLDAAVARREFRLDLYHRISAVILEMPPLRARGRDVLALAESFLVRSCAEYGLEPKRLGAAAEGALLAHPWPGNVRELRNAIERAVLLADGDEITPELMELPRSRSHAAASPRTRPEGGDEGESLRDTLEAAGWNLSRAAARLGIPRNTLRYRIERLGLRPVAVDVAAPEPAGPTPAPATELRWEKRWIAAVQVRLALPPARSSYHLTPLLEELIEKARSFGGRLDALHPLGFTALYGIEPMEAAPTRAALAAQAIVNAAAGYREADGERAGAGCRVHAAECLIARGAPIVGMSVEDRRRLDEALDAIGMGPGLIAVSAEAVPFLERRFIVEPEVAGTVTTYRLAGPGRSGFDVGGQQPSPFVGRARELARLRDLLAAAERGRGQVVDVMGEPGVGKSRLLHEFRRTVGPDRVLYLEGRCTAHGASTPYLPLVHLLQQCFGFTEADGSEAIRVRVREGVARLGLSAGTVAPYLLHLLGVPGRPGDGVAGSSPESVRARTVDALRYVMIAASQQRPVILAIEDLQWMDPTSVASLAVLAPSVAASRILVLTTCRRGHRPPWLGRAHASQIDLDRLGPTESLTIVQALLAGREVAAGVADALVSKADGIPFFLEELARVIVADPASRVPGIPDTVHEAIAARVDRLAPADRDLLQGAAVLGRDVPRALLREMSGLADPEFGIALSRLRVTGFLRETAADPEGCGFTHVLTQETAYRSLTAERRRALHEAAAAAIEKRQPELADRHPEVLAHHLTEAGATTAAAYWHRAGRLAIRRSANAEALAHLRRALVLLEAQPRGAERARAELGLQLTVGAALVADRGYGARELDLTMGRLEALIGEVVDAPEVPVARFALCRFSIARADLAAAGRFGQEMLTAAGSDPEALVPASVAAGITDFYLGRFLRAREHFERALAVHEPRFAEAQIARYGNDMRVAALGFLGWTCALTGELDRAARLAEECVTRARESGHPLTLAVALNWAGLVRCERHEPAQAARLGEELLDLSREQSFAFFAALALGLLGWARLARGERAAGAELLRQGFDRYRAASQRVGLRPRAHHVEGLLSLGAVDEALERLEEFIAHSRDTGERGLVSELYRLKGEALARRAPTDPEAIRTLEQAVAIAQEQGATLLALRAAIGLVQLERERGDAAPSLAPLRRAYQGMTEGSDHPHMQAARALLGE
jgi:transcriptional regulator with AAA-type ATPase domain/tetratricopeptide (TPR) repeat protein